MQGFRKRGHVVSDPFGIPNKYKLRNEQCIESSLNMWYIHNLLFVVHGGIMKSHKSVCVCVCECMNTFECMI